MKIIFNKLILHDFKGIRDYEISFDKDMTNLFAGNGQGKSTIVDALFWLFFGKDAFGASNFKLLPLDDKGELIPETIPTVVLDFTHGAKQNVYSRAKKGSKTNYLINDSKVTATEFKRHVGSVVTEKLFSALLSPVYFGNNYSWQEQRDTILGNMKFENTVIEDFEYEDVAEEILKDGIDKTLLKYDNKRKELNKSKEQYIGTRDYLANKLKDADTSITQEELVKQTDLKKAEIKVAEMTLDSLHPIQTEIADKERQLQSEEMNKSKLVQAKKSELSTLESKVSMELSKQKDEINSKIRQLNQDISFEVKNLKSKKNNEIASANRERNDYLSQYKGKLKELNDVTDVCSLCGSKLDEFEVSNQKVVLKGLVDEILLKGKTKAGLIKNLESELCKIKEDESKLLEIETLTAELETIEIDTDSAETITLLKSEISSAGMVEIGTELKEEIVTLKEKETDIRNKVNYDKIQLFRNELSTLEKQVNEYEFVVKDKLDLDKTIKRLRDIMGEYDDAEDIITAIKEYRIDYAQMIADNLNEKLNRVRIKTFIPQGDDPPKETFEISMDGVPYVSLNSAGKIEAGIELIQLLSNSLEICFPIFIDNKEGIIKDFDIENQLITLSVKDMGNYKELINYKAIATDVEILAMKREMNGGI